MSDPLLACRNMSLLMLIIILLTVPSPSIGLAQTYDEPLIVKPTPTLRVAGADDLTTVLLINNDGLGGRLGENHGRFLSVRPELGLLTSTARTFIQEGITTEYATQVVGTTLNNGRLYAQYLKKTSRVLFENGQVQPSVVTSWVGDGVQTRSYLESHNDLLNAEAPDWRDIDDRLEYVSVVDDEFVGNTDYLRQKYTSTQLTVKEKAPSSVVSMDTHTLDMAQSGFKNDLSTKMAAQKVLPVEEILTLTVKNHFEPSGYHDAQDEGRSAKEYYQQIMRKNQENEPDLSQSQSLPQASYLTVPKKKKELSTVTYYGFADFTTLVGESLIVFSPSTTQPSAIIGHVTSISGMATLKTNDFHTHFKGTDKNNRLTTSFSSGIETAFIDAKTAVNSMLFTLAATPTLDASVPEKKSISQQNVEFNESNKMYSLPTDQEILEIYASLSKDQAGQMVSITPDDSIVSTVSSEKGNASLQFHGGATTVFIDDDPFANFVKPTSLVTSYSLKTSTAITIATSVYNETTSVEAASKMNNETVTFEETTTHNLELPLTTTSFDGDDVEEIEEESLTTTNKPLSEEGTTVASATDDISHIELPQKVQTAAETTTPSESTTIEDTTIPADESSTNISDVKATDDDDYVTESDISLMEDERDNDDDDDDYENNNGLDDGMDLFYKTLYTTYTYLTTFFRDTSTTVSSHTEIFTNIITSTLEITKVNDISPSNTLGGVKSIFGTEVSKLAASTTLSKYMILDELESLLHTSANEHVKDDLSQQTSFPDDISTKTFYTTFTYYTTIFADDETEIMSRTEVFTNFVTKPSTSYSNNENPINVSPTQVFKSKTLENVATNDDHEKLVTLITDVRSSSSNGKQQVIGQVDDQISSESNIEEILPSPTLLLQTSFTTFTYYTTMYVLDSTNVVSRLETITNIATETLQPTKILSNDDATLPITFFTTFTYWTKLAKNGEISTISREETISSIIQPTAQSKVLVIPNDFSTSLQTMSEDLNVTNFTSEVSELTTFFTTYTYYTTSYEANKTVTDSRFETIVNIVNASVSNTFSLLIEPTPMTTTASATMPLFNSAVDFDKPDLVLYEHKHIVDAEGVSTLYFTTKIQSTINLEGEATEFTSSTSSLFIDETRKSSLATVITDQAIASDSQTHKIGLVRLIEGTRVANKTTTLYQSKVIGTIIDNRYAQIIESTSSFLFEKAIKTVETILPTVVTVDDLFVSSTLQSVGIPVEGSINSDIVSDSTPSNDEGDTNNANNDQLSYQSKKRTFAPVIRPFASRNRPTFAPKQKTLSASSATIITRSDITPTITATPALKTVGSRYSTSRRGVISNVPTNPTTSSSRRLFGRPTKSSTGTSVASSQSLDSSTGFAPSNRNRFASSSRSVPISSSRRLSSNASYRPSSSSNGFRVSALTLATSRQRIQPTAAVGQSVTATATATLDNNNEEENISNEEPIATKDDQEISSQNSRRNQNPLLRFRRPLSRPSGFTTAPRSSASASLATISQRKNPLSGRAKTAPTTTTATPTTNRPRPRSFQRPTVSSIQPRVRPQSNLFPPRGLFQHQQKNQVTTTDQNELDNDSEYDDNDEVEEETDNADADDQNDANRRRRRVDANLSNLSRKRREADSLNRNRFRFRRPKTIVSEEPPIINLNSDEPSETTSNQTRAKMNSRFGSRHQQKQQTTSTASVTTSIHRSIRPTRPTLPRAQFTLRDKDITTIRSISNRQGGSSFRRPQQVTSVRRNQSGNGSGSPTNSRRLKSYSKLDGPNQRGTSKSRNLVNGSNGSSRGRVTMRGRKRNDYNLEVAAMEQGSSATITVTHLIPAEVTVPVVNGHMTEYKNIVTGKTSIEVLGPNQYTKMLGNNGQTSLFLTREDSSINAGGVTELTRYLLHDSLTTTITFTPTTIRGRKTSFSHVLPSTVYSVENIVSTLQPHLTANAPLANILLSQLLLGNINLPLGQPGQSRSALVTGEESSIAAAQQPVTNYLTHTSSYVTTIYDGKSTILPITFQGDYNKNHVKHYSTQGSTKNEATNHIRYRLKNIRMLNDDNNHLAITSDISLEEARFNLATHVMSNGVELIIASDKLIHKQNDKQSSSISQGFGSASVYLQPKPFTLAPSTLKNHMVLTLPTIYNQENFTIPIDDNQFLTKTCVTTYTFHTTYVSKGSTKVESMEKVVINRHTEERNFFVASTLLSLGVTLSNTPELVVGIFPTTYHYYNTLRSNMVITSAYTVINTVTGPAGYMSYLQPSEEATPLLDTNTYYSRVPITRTMLQSDGLNSMSSSKVVTDESILTQVVITESIPGRSKSKIQSKISDEMNDDVQIYATKTYLSTITYIATSKTLLQTTKFENKINISNSYHTKVLVNTITDIVPSTLLKPELVSMFRTELMQKKGKNNQKVFVTLATLVSGETLQVTAVNLKKLQPTATAAMPSILLGTKHFKLITTPSSNSSIMPNTVQNQNTNIEETQTQKPITTDDLKLSESGHKNVSVRPSKESLPSSSSPNIAQLIGSINLHRLRPVFNAMADLIQKNIVNSQKTLLRQHTKEIKSNFLSHSKIQLNQSTTSLEDKPPVYIPLQVAGHSHHRNQQYTKQINKPKTSDSYLNKLTAHSLQYYPPERELDLDLSDDNWLSNQQNSVTRNNHRTLSVYQSSLLNKDIPIRPGEIISANADVIIGRPIGIGINTQAHFLRSSVESTTHNFKSFIENSDRMTINYSTMSPFKKKSWIPPQIKHSLTPPHIIPLQAGSAHSYQTLKINLHPQNYDNILRPPAQTSGSASTSSPYILKPPPTAAARIVNNINSRKNVNSFRAQQQQQIIKINSELNHNEIIEIRPIPQIFSTKLPAETRLPVESSSSRSYIESPSPKAAHHTQRINLKMNVLSHNVNMNAPPLTFKKENDNYPFATAVHGHIAPAPMPLIKIPHNKVNVQVRLTPHNNRITVELPPKEPKNHPKPNNTSTLKHQRNEHLFRKNNSNNLALFQNLGTNTTNEITISNVPKINASINRTSNWDDLSTSESMPNFVQAEANSIRSDNTHTRRRYQQLLASAKPNTNSTKIEKQIKKLQLENDERLQQQGQNTDFATYSTNLNVQNPNTLLIFETNIANHIASINPLESLSNHSKFASVTLPWTSMTKSVNNNKNKLISFGQPFIKPNLAQSKENSTQYANIKTGLTNTKKLYLANGQSFNLGPKPKFNLSQAIETLQKREKSGIALLHKESNILAPPLVMSTNLKITNDVRWLTSQLLSPTRVTEIPNTLLAMSTTLRLSSSIQTPSSQEPLSTLNLNTSIGTRYLLGSKEQLFSFNSYIIEPFTTQQNFIVQKTKTINTKPIPSATPAASIIKSTFSHTNLSKEIILSPTITNFNFESSLMPRKSVNFKTLIDKSRGPIVSLESSEGVLSKDTKIPFSMEDNVSTTRKAFSQLDNSKKIKYLVDTLLTKLHTTLLKSKQTLSFSKVEFVAQPSSATNMMRLGDSQTMLTKSQTQIKKGYKLTPTRSMAEQTSFSKHQLISINNSKTTTDKIRPEISTSLVVMTKSTGNKQSDITDLAAVPLEYDSFDLPTRDEEISSPINSNSVLLGGVVIATPSITKYSKEPDFKSTSLCNPVCNWKRNEICSSSSRCECRLGFARMFPDRPCKPTYTFEIRIPTNRVGSYQLNYSLDLMRNLTSQYRHLSSIILDAIDRMVMQSDFRDVYYGVQLKEFYTIRDDAVMGLFLLQLSENSDEKRLETVFKKQLRQGNYSIGGTELYTSKAAIKYLTVRDFDECGIDQFNDCSLHAHCFNLVGSYTCGCKDGYIDLSNNAIYPGRFCEDHIIGCETCHYHGNCISQTLNGVQVCECFSWHAGSKCQLNLKILLISLFAIGTVFLFLLICVILIYSRRKVKGSCKSPIFITASNYRPSMLTSSSNKSLTRECSMEKHTILFDSNSESSHISEAYLFNAKSIQNQRKNFILNEPKPNTPYGSESIGADQSSRSLSVKIPRAKYYHPTSLTSAKLTDENIVSKGLSVQNLTNNDKGLKPLNQELTKPYCKENAAQVSGGSLVSAGFEVSAIVCERGEAKPSSISAIDWKEYGNTCSESLKMYDSQNLNEIISHHGEAADVRSFDEATVQALTKSIHLGVDMQTQSNINEEANGMTERDIGSTFLLPHTHLYKPEKLESDVSGFESI